MVPRLGGRSVLETMREFSAIVPWRTVQHSFTLVGSHDTTRVRSLVGEDPRQVDVAAGLLMTMPGIPMVTYGDEIGMRGDFGEDGRRPMPWDESQWDRGLLRGLPRAHRCASVERGPPARWPALGPRRRGRAGLPAADAGGDGTGPLCPGRPRPPDHSRATPDGSREGP